MVDSINRIICKTSKLVDYFTEDGLIKQIGLTKEYWNRVIIKEIVDNALDAIEPLNNKEIHIIQSDSSLGIYDNGNGLGCEIIKSIYDFNFYVSQNRIYVTASRGKQGNGLKTIISICFLKKYRLLWHTNEGIILEGIIDTEKAKNGEICVDFRQLGTTEKRGIEIFGYELHQSAYYKNYVYFYTVCNPDVTFHLDYLGIEFHNPATAECVDKSQNISLAYYDYDTFKQFITDTQDGNSTYKKFLEEYFGTRIKNKSGIKSKIKDIDFNGQEFINDFLALKEDQQTKKYTLLKKQLIGLENVLNTSIEMEDSSSLISKSDMVIPCIVEFSVKKDTFKGDTNRKEAGIECYINNSITYNNSWSIGFDGGWYKIGNKTVYARDLDDLLKDMSNFSFVFHIVSPYLKFTDAGKTRIDITSFFNELLEKLNKAIAKENRLFSSDNKRTNNRAVMRDYVTDAFNMASDNGRYAITARQIWYKMREISGIEEKKHTYADFTQEILTEWIDDNPKYEDKVNFSDRGNFFVDGSQNGLGTANVRNFINTIGTSQNIFKCYGGISNNIHIEPDFDLIYKYDKVLYIEKTGFDAIFKAEKVGEKYNMIIVSGQGFSTRAAKTLLYKFQQMGLKLYCLHDLDISGIYILDSFGTPNKKFKEHIYMENLGVTLADVEKYHIEPEKVDIKQEDKKKLKNLSYEYRRFFDAGTSYRRVELNAFTTAEILEILENKLSAINNLPTINLEESLNVDHKAIRETAFMRIMAEKYREQLDKIHVPIDLSAYKGKYTVDMAKEEIPDIEERLIEKYEREIAQKLNIS